MLVPVILNLASITAPHFVRELFNGDGLHVFQLFFSRFPVMIQNDHRVSRAACQTIDDCADVIDVV